MRNATNDSGNELYITPDGGVIQYSPTRGLYWWMESEDGGFREAPEGLRRLVVED